MTDNDQIQTYTSQASTFLSNAWEHLNTGDLHQASEKGWGAAAHMAKAVALKQGWTYESHSHYRQVMNRVLNLTANDRVRVLRAIAEALHANFYNTRDNLDTDTIRRDLADIAELLDILEQLT